LREYLQQHEEELRQALDNAEWTELIDPADKYCDYVLLMRYSFTWKKKMREGHRSASMKGVSKSCGSNGKDTAR